MADRIQENRIKEDKNILLHYLKVEVLLLDYENIIKTFHKITKLEEKTPHGDMLEELNGNHRDQETEKTKK